MNFPAEPQTCLVALTCPTFRNTKHVLSDFKRLLQLCISSPLRKQCYVGQYEPDLKKCT